jgi:hypothetical protein
VRHITQSEKVRDALLSGTIASAATAAIVAACGARDSGSALAPINAVSHIVWGDGASNVPVADLKHTVPGLLLNTGATVFWSAIYEGIFGRAADRGQIAKALLGGGAVAALAYATDYYVVPKRLTPGWEERVTNRSLALVYVVLALSSPVRGLLHHCRRSPRRVPAGSSSTGGECVKPRSPG